MYFEPELEGRGDEDAGATIGDDGDDLGPSVSYNRGTTTRCELLLLCGVRCVCVTFGVVVTVLLLHCHSGEVEPPSMSRPNSKRWPLALLVAVCPRRYLLRRCALELFFADGRSLFFSFDSTAKADRAFRLIADQKHPLFSEIRCVSELPPAVCA